MSITNWYDKLPTKAKLVDKNFKKHHILPNSMIVVIGGTGSGKSNAIIDMIHRMEKFYEIIIFNPVSTDEPLYDMFFLKQKMPDVQLISEIEELPELKSFEDDKDMEKLLIVDDWINMSKKDQKKINEYFTGGRKAGFTVVALCQSYTAVPKIVIRNAQYFFIFKLNDNVTINTVIRNHNIYSVPKEEFRAIYDDATHEQFSFLMVDLKTKDKKEHLRKNFLGFYTI